MQLSAVLAQPPIPKQDGASPFLSILTTLRSTPPPATAAAPAVPAAATATAATASVAVEEAQPSLGQKLLGGVAENQNSYLANQQMLAVISAGLGARITQVAKNAWSQLRGTEPPAESPPAA